MKKINIEFDNVIKNNDDLINQLKSLRTESVVMMQGTCGKEEIFVKDFHALSIVISYLKEVFKND